MVKTITASEAARAFAALDGLAYELSDRIEKRGSQLGYEPLCQHLAILSALLGNVHNDLKNFVVEKLESLGDIELSPEATTSLQQLWALCLSMVFARSDFLVGRRVDPTPLIIPRSPFSAAEAGAGTAQAAPTPATEQDLLRLIQRIKQATTEKAQRFLRMLADLDNALSAITDVLAQRRPVA